MLRRHLMTHYNMTPEDYRAKWNLPKDYPMVAPNYAEKRRALAKAIGLGSKGSGGGRTKATARGEIPPQGRRAGHASQRGGDPPPRTYLRSAARSQVPVNNGAAG